MWPQMTSEIMSATGQTVMMVFASTALSFLLGLPLGVLLFVTDKNQLLSRPRFNRILGLMVNALRSVPFIILMVAIIPLTRFLVGSSIGTAAAVVPLALAAIPFFARIAESALAEVPSGLVEAANSMGATPLQIIWRVFIPEAWPGIIRGVTLTCVTLVGYSAMAGVVGGGGLGDLAIRYGYQRFEVGVMLITVLILIVMVQLIQYLGDKLALKLAHQK